MLTPLQIKGLIRALRNQEIVIMPTDTVYGLGAIKSSTNQIKINRLKQAPLEKPLIILISNEQQLADWVDSQEYTKYSQLLNSGITLVFRSRQNSQKTIAVRLIKRPDLVAVINQTGPLWSSSANLHKNQIVKDLKQIKRIFPNITTFEDPNYSHNNPSKIYDTVNNKWLR